MSGKDVAALLVSCIKDRDLKHNTSELLSDLERGGHQDLEAWVLENLGRETLLTKEELSLYSSLQKTGEAEALAASQNLDHVRGLEDWEIQNAINQLQSSTAIIEKQNEVLKIQQDAMASLVATNARQRQGRLAADSAKQRGWIAECDQVNNAVKELISGLSEYANEIESQFSATDVTLVHQSSDVVRSDDKILESLQKLSGALGHVSSADDAASGRIRQLCASLIKYTVESVRIRLDRVYLEGVEGAQLNTGDVGYQQNAEVTALQEELESLYSEILPVAQMSVEQRYLQCALRAIASQGNQGLERSGKIIDYISGCVSFLTSRLVSFSGQAEEYQAHAATLNAVIKLLRTEIDSVGESSPPKQQSLGSPLRRRDSKPMSPVRSRTTARRRSSASSFDENTAPEHQLLRFLGISLPDEPYKDVALTRSLHDTLADRVEKLKAHEHGLEASFESSIAEHLQDAFVTVQLLRDSVLSETKSRAVQLVDEEVQAAISGLEQDLSNLRNDLDSVDLEKLRERNVNREALIERWAR